MSAPFDDILVYLDGSEGSMAASMYAILLAKETGARGLRSILEKLMTDIMFDIPSRQDIEKVTITKETVDGGEPILWKKSA